MNELTVDLVQEETARVGAYVLTVEQVASLITLSKENSEQLQIAFATVFEEQFLGIENSALLVTMLAMLTTGILGFVAKDMKDVNIVGSIVVAFAFIALFLLDSDPMFYAIPSGWFLGMLAAEIVNRIDGNN